MPNLGHESPGGFAMVEPTSAFIEFSNSAAELVERAAASVVSVRGGGRWSTSGVHWRSGVIVTAEEVLDRDENIRLILPGGREVAASLAGRDPTTDVAVLRFQPDGLPIAAIAGSASRPGQAVIAVGSHEGAPLAAFGIIAYAGGAWQSMRGGAIDSLIHLDLTLRPAAEGGAVVDSVGRVIGMTVLGPRRRPLAIPASTIDRSVDQLLARGRVFRGYLGAGLQSVRRAAAADGSQASNSGRGVLVVSVDPDGPSARVGLLVGDIIGAWNGKPIERVRDVMRLLGPESVGTTVDLSLVRAGAPATLKIIIGERPVA
jgi:S1-C subfamily serine protease